MNHRNTHLISDAAITLLIVGLLLLSARGFTEFGMGRIPQELGLGLIISLSALTYIPFIRRTKWYGVTILIVLGLFALAVEMFGIQTCLLYGCFSYGNDLGYKIMGLVPWVLFFTWPPLVLGTTWMLHRIHGSILFKAVLGGLLLVLVDLVLDPVAIHQGFWTFTDPGVRHNVPLANFIGWFVSGSLGTYILLSLLKDAQHSNEATAHYMWWSFGALLMFFTASAGFLGLRGAMAVGIGLIIMLKILVLRQGNAFSTTPLPIQQPGTPQTQDAEK